MKKYEDDGRDCESCIGYVSCLTWMQKELKAKRPSCNGWYYANKEQVEGLLTDWDYRRGKIKPKCKDDKMIKYRACSSYTQEIETVECKRETESSVWVHRDGDIQQFVKNGENVRYCDTWDEAHVWLMKKAEKKVDRIRHQLEQVKSLIGNLKGMKTKCGNNEKKGGDKLSDEHTEYICVENFQRGKMLKIAIETINGERQDIYGDPEDSFDTIADYWRIYLESIGVSFDISDLSRADIPIMMALFKIARMSGQKYTQDNFVDAAGYLGIADDIAAQEDGK